MTGQPPTGARRPITAEDLFAFSIVSDPQPAPDGSSIAYVVTRLDQEADDYKAAIWLVPADGGDPVQLTSGAFRDTAPRWSPDGAQIAFVSNRPGLAAPKSANDEGKADPKSANKGTEKPKSQIWTIRVAGGEARQLTNNEHGASAPVWSPDGRTVAFLSSTLPDGEPGVPDSPHKKVADERILTKLRYRFDGRGWIERYAHVWTIPADGGDAKQLTFGDADDSQIAWSPDGRTIAFVANRHPDRDQINRSLIYTVPAQGGELRCLTEGDYDFDSPSWSPDGTRLAVIGGDDPDSGGAKNANLWTVPAGGGDPTNRTKGWDRSFGDSGMSDLFQAADQRPVWSSDGAEVMALASDRGNTHVFRVTLVDGEVHQVTSGNRRVTNVVRVGDGRRVAYVSGTGATPFELFIADRDGSNERQLSNQNATLLNEVAISEPEEFTFKSQAGDLDIQGWILKPHGFSEGVKYPLIVQIHGGPHSMYAQAMFHEMQLMAARGYVVVFTNPRGSAGYGEAFTSCTRGRWGESDMPDVMGAVDAILERGYVDEARMGVTGGSYGGYMTNWIIGHTDRFKAAVTQRCVANFYSMVGTSDIGVHFGVYEFGGTPWENADTLLKYSPISYVQSMTTPLLIIHNEQDLRCPIEQAEQLYTFLKRLGRDVAMVRIPEEDHNLSRTGKPSRRLARLHHLIGWFDSHL